MYLQEKQMHLLEKWKHIVVYVSYKIQAKLKSLFDVQKIYHKHTWCVLTVFFGESLANSF